MALDPITEANKVQGTANLYRDDTGYTGQIGSRKVRASSVGDYRQQLREYRERQRQTQATRKDQLDAERSARMGGMQFSGLGSPGIPRWMAPWQISQRQMTGPGQVGYQPGQFARATVNQGVQFLPSPQGLPAGPASGMPGQQLASDPIATLLAQLQQQQRRSPY
jgi:hypothetical protein